MIKSIQLFDDKGELQETLILDEPQNLRDILREIVTGTFHSNAHKTLMYAKSVLNCYSEGTASDCIREIDEAYNYKPIKHIRIR